MDFSDFTGQVQREKDVCEYEVHLQSPTLERAMEVKRITHDIADPWIADYIWQEQKFELDVRNGNFFFHPLICLPHH